jgi:hypothetical protein
LNDLQQENEYPVIDDPQAALDAPTETIRNCPEASREYERSCQTTL